MGMTNLAEWGCSPEERGLARTWGPSSQARSTASAFKSRAHPCLSPRLGHGAPEHASRQSAISGPLNCARIDRRRDGYGVDGCPPAWLLPASVRSGNFHTLMSAD